MGGSGRARATRTRHALAALVDNTKTTTGRAHAGRALAADGQAQGHLRAILLRVPAERSSQALTGACTVSRSAPRLCAPSLISTAFAAIPAILVGIKAARVTRTRHVATVPVENTKTPRAPHHVIPAHWANTSQTQDRSAASRVPQDSTKIDLDNSPADHVVLESITRTLPGHHPATAAAVLLGGFKAALLNLPALAAHKACINRILRRHHAATVLLESTTRGHPRLRQAPAGTARQASTVTLGYHGNWGPQASRATQSVPLWSWDAWMQTGA